tara:strand:+ start:51465 stop:53660 length:2196 start_codon:yes stop_codon:yes gene_type:complete
MSAEVDNASGNQALTEPQAMIVKNDVSWNGSLNSCVKLSDTHVTLPPNLKMIGGSVQFHARGDDEYWTCTEANCKHPLHVRMFLQPMPMKDHKRNFCSVKVDNRPLTNNYHAKCTSKRPESGSKSNFIRVPYAALRPVEESDQELIRNLINDSDEAALSDCSSEEQRLMLEFQLPKHRRFDPEKRKRQKEDTSKKINEQLKKNVLPYFGFLGEEHPPIPVKLKLELNNDEMLDSDDAESPTEFTIPGDLTYSLCFLSEAKDNLGLIPIKSSVFLLRIRFCNILTQHEFDTISNCCSKEKIVFREYKKESKAQEEEEEEEEEEEDDDDEEEAEEQEEDDEEEEEDSRIYEFIGPIEKIMVWNAQKQIHETGLESTIWDLEAQQNTESIKEAAKISVERQDCEILDRLIQVFHETNGGDRFCQLMLSDNVKMTAQLDGVKSKLKQEELDQKEEDEKNSDLPNFDSNTNEKVTAIEGQKLKKAQLKTIFEQCHVTLRNTATNKNLICAIANNKVLYEYLKTKRVIDPKLSNCAEFDHQSALLVQGDDLSDEDDPSWEDSETEGMSIEKREAATEHDYRTGLAEQYRTAETSRCMPPAVYMRQAERMVKRARLMFEACEREGQVCNAEDIKFVMNGLHGLATGLKDTLDASALNYEKKMQDHNKNQAAFSKAQWYSRPSVVTWLIQPKKIKPVPHSETPVTFRRKRRLIFDGTFACVPKNGANYEQVPHPDNVTP